MFKLYKCPYCGSENVFVSTNQASGSSDNPMMLCLDCKEYFTANEGLAH